MVDEPLDYEGFTPDQRQGVIDALAERLNAVHGELLRAVLAADRLKDFRADGVLSMAEWLSYRYNLAPRTARQWVRAAHALDEMPLLRAQYVAGNVGFEQLMSALSYAQPDDDADAGRDAAQVELCPGGGHRPRSAAECGPAITTRPVVPPGSVCGPTARVWARASRGSCPPKTPPISTKPSPAAPKRPDPTPRPVCGHPSTVAWPARCATSAPRISPRQLPPARTPTPPSW